MFHLLEQTTLNIISILILLVGGTKCKLGLYEVSIENSVQLQAVKELSSELNWDWVKQPIVNAISRFTAEIESHNEIESKLSKIFIQLKLIDTDVERILDDSMKANQKVKNINQFRSLSNGDSSINYFAKYTEINKWLESMASKYPDLVSLQSIGKSFEKRDMIVARISTSSNDLTKPVIFLDAGIHAREWLSVSTILWIMNKLIGQYKSGENKAKTILSKYDVYFLPVTNPDGYERSHNGGRDRYWRKNTQPVGSGCIGIDLNRNFDADFGVSGVSKNPCDSTFPGLEAFSAPETRNFRDFVLAQKSRMRLFISFHAFGQMLLTPWAYTQQPPPDSEDLDRVGRLMVNAIKQKSGSNYIQGSPAKILYAASGGSFDWVKKVGIKYAYTFEVNPDRESRLGFAPPPSFINSTGDDMYEAFIVASTSI